MSFVPISSLMNIYQFHSFPVPQPEGCYQLSISCRSFLCQIHVRDFRFPCATKQNHNCLLSPRDRLTGMSGTFNSTIQDEINGQSTAPIGASATPSATATGTGMSSVKTSATSSHASSTSSSAKATSTSSTGAAGKLEAAGVACLIGTAASLIGAAFF